jgi:hypothetical protein
MLFFNNKADQNSKQTSEIYSHLTNLTTSTDMGIFPSFDYIGNSEIVEKEKPIGCCSKSKYYNNKKIAFVLNWDQEQRGLRVFLS